MRKLFLIGLLFVTVVLHAQVTEEVEVYVGGNWWPCYVITFNTKNIEDLIISYDKHKDLIRIRYNLRLAEVAKAAITKLYPNRKVRTYSVLTLDSARNGYQIICNNDSFYMWRHKK